VKFKFDNPIWVGLMWVVAIIVGLRLGDSRPGYAGSFVGQRAAVVLEPKANLKTENGRGHSPPTFRAPSGGPNSAASW
jgi:hypothetical protein